MKKTINSLYIHIPFCNKICAYCDFLKFFNLDSLRINYLKELKKDLQVLTNTYNPFKTIYVGGGTPSVLTSKELDDLLGNIDPLIALNDYEFTIEANPESLNEEKLIILAKHHVNRISIGVESFNERILNLIDRNYRVDIFKLISLTKKYISNINVDLIYGFPDETQEELEFDLNNFLSLNIDHISIYSLMIEENTKLNNLKINEADQDTLRNQYDFILNTLRKNGYKRYEVSNFARNNNFSKHNLNYWKNNQYVAIGVGASGYEGNIRYKNSSNITLYNKGERKREEEILSFKDLRDYFLITNLRLEDGFNLLKFKELFSEDLIVSKNEVIGRLLKNNLIEIKNNFLAPTDNGLMILDSWIVDLL